MSDAPRKPDGPALSPPDGAASPAAGAYPPGPAADLPLLLERAQAQLWQSPFPPPDAVERYERVLPGAFDRILRMNEQLQAANVASLERAHRFMHVDMRRGHWLGFAISAGAMVAALGCVALHAPWVAGGFLALPVMGVARALIDSAQRGHEAQQDRSDLQPRSRKER